MPPTSLKAALYRDEGVRLKPYLDCCGKPWRDCTCKTKGKLTLGVGRNIDDVGISIGESDTMLDNDITRASAAVYRHLTWIMNLDEVRREALINLAFNVGVAGLLGFTRMLTALERGDYETAARELLDSKYRKQVLTRAERLAEQIRSGERQ